MLYKELSSNYFLSGVCYNKSLPCYIWELSFAAQPHLLSEPRSPKFMILLQTSYSSHKKMVRGKAEQNRVTLFVFVDGTKKYMNNNYYTQ